MSSRKTVLALFLAFFIPSALLVALQNDSTNQTWPSNFILHGYYLGLGLKEVLGSAPISIVEARCLVRGVLIVCERLGGAELPVYNAMIQLVSAWAALCMIYLTAARLMTPARACAAVLVAVVFVPWGFVKASNSVSWPYDLPSLFFASFGLWTILSRRFVLFAVTLVLGTLNKETIVCLLPAYLLAEWPLLPRKTWLVRALILGSLFVVTYEIPRMILAGNSAPLVTVSANDLDVPRWDVNIQHLLLLKNSVIFENIYLTLSLHLLPVFNLSKLPRPLRAVYFAVPALLVPIFFCGNIYEYRLYNEIIPLGAISTVLVFMRLLEAADAPAPAPVVANDARGSLDTAPAVAVIPPGP